MHNDILALPSRRKMAALSLGYALLILYSSTLIGPSGIHYVYRDPAEAFQSFLHTPLVSHGSDQRADWIGNLLMLVPLGFVTTATLWPKRRGMQLPAMTCGLAICAAAILSIKYLQLFFPPRTVTLNYILAQSIGAALGCLGCWLWNQRIDPAVRRADPVSALVVVLWLYTGALCLFLLMPLDFALDMNDLRAQFARVPDTVWTLPGNGRPAPLRAVLIAMATLSFVPVGMLLTFVRTGTWRVNRGMAAVLGMGLQLTAGLYGLSLLVISAFPVLPAVLYRLAGIGLGAAAIHWLVRQDHTALKRRIAGWIPILLPLYLVGVLLVNRLISPHWLSLPEAIAQAYPLGFLPLFDYYIVTKAEAAKNIVGHAVLYMPIGVMFWLRSSKGSGGKAFVSAALLSLCVEAARYFRPGLEGDVNAVVVAGLSAMGASRAMTPIWSMVQTLGRQAGIDVSAQA